MPAHRAGAQVGARGGEAHASAAVAMLKRVAMAPPTGVALAFAAWAAIVAFCDPFGRLWGTGQDARSYWLANLGDPYRNSSWTEPLAYVYSPAFLQVVAPVTALAWPAFIGAWTAILLVAVRLLTGPRLFAVGIIVAAMELAGGNISLLLALAIVGGFRWPALWSFVLLTKVTPGIGLLWFAVRHEWRSLSVAVIATAVVVLLSWTVMPGAWTQWLDVLTASAGRHGTWAAVPVPLWARLPVAVAVVVWGARTDRRWTVPVAAMLALPALWYGSLSMLLAVLALRDDAAGTLASRAHSPRTKWRSRWVASGAALLLIAALLLSGCARNVGGSTPAPTPLAPLAWSRHDLAMDGPAIRAVVPGGPGFIGVSAAAAPEGGGSGIWTSPDGVTWTAVDSPRADRNLVDITTGGPGFVAISAVPATVWTSADGLSWREAPPVPSFDEGVLTSVASARGTLVAAGQGRAWTSRDGLTWEEADVPDDEGTIHDVVAGGPGFVAVGSILVGSMEAKGVVWTSTDGRTWRRLPDRPEFERSELRAVAAHGDSLVATGWTSDLERGLFFVPSAWTSMDGATWRRATVNDDELPAHGSLTGGLEGAAMIAVARTDDRWVSAGLALTNATDQSAADAAIWTSVDDGNSWERVPHDARLEAGMTGSTDLGASSIAVAGSHVIVVGRTEGPRTSVWISPPQPGGVSPSPRPPLRRPTAETMPPNAATPAPPAPVVP